MTETEKIEYAKSFIDKLAEGINPIDGSEVPEGEVIHNVRISRCFFFVSEILRGVIEGRYPEGEAEVKPVPVRKKKPSTVILSDEARESLKPKDVSTNGSDITDRINSVIDEASSAKLKRTTLNAWLLSLGFLEVRQVFGKDMKLPTKAGTEIGIYTEERSSAHGSYVAMLFGKDAQQFVFDNLDSLFAYQNGEGEESGEKTSAKPQNKSWHPAENDSLIRMFRAGASCFEIAKELKRDSKDIEDRLSRLGLI